MITGTDIIQGIGVSRPDLVPNVPLYVTDPLAPGGWRINRAAFTIPVGRQGTLGRNALRNFPMWQLDLSLRRQFKLTERVNLQFLLEVFNVFNHPNFLIGNSRATPEHSTDVWSCNNYVGPGPRVRRSEWWIQPALPGRRPTFDPVGREAFILIFQA